MVESAPTTRTHSGSPESRPSSFLITFELARPNAKGMPTWMIIIKKFKAFSADGRFLFNFDDFR